MRIPVPPRLLLQRVPLMGLVFMVLSMQGTVHRLEGLVFLRWLACGIDAMYSKGALCQIDSKLYDSHGHPFYSLG